MGLTATMRRVAEKCAEKVFVPDNRGCCRAWGDSGFIFSELSESATWDERHEIGHDKFDGCYSWPIPAKFTCSTGSIR